ncbi:MAG: DEAD/DEAH box helicase [Myxococcota bacterium]|nr:DEAD/DEAH box helicase [Myxococcota bacterium]
MKFLEFGLDPAILSAVEKLGFENATSVQAETIPTLMEGRDMIGQARTGSGKTAAFGLPMLERVKEGGKNVRGLVLAPTRELAMQVAEALRSFAKDLPVRVVAIYGGAPYPPQLKALKNGATIVVGTPGRVIDHMERGTLKLQHVEFMALDEADEMLRMGFIEAVEQVLEALPDERQVALFSATMPKPIQRVSKRFLNNPATIEVETEALSVDHIEQYWIRVPQRHKLDCLRRILQGDPGGATLIFTRTRVGCAEVAEGLQRCGIAADAIHGDLNQSARERVLNRLRSKSLTVLVATDVAARGLDVSHLTRVINCDFPDGPEPYVHRIGRTGRAGAKGLAITLVTPSQQGRLRQLKKTIRFDIQETHPPSNAEVAAFQRNALWQEVASQAENTDLSNLHEWLYETGLETGIEPQIIAAAAVQLLAKHRGTTLFAPKDEPEGYGSNRKRGAPKDTGEMARVNEVEIFLGIGSNAGIRPADIVGALANEVGIPGNEIGRISLFDRKTLVGLPRDVADHVLAAFPVLMMRGKPIRLKLSRHRPTSGPGPKKPRGPKKGRPSYPQNKRGPSKGPGKGRPPGKSRTRGKGRK